MIGAAFVTEWRTVPKKMAEWMKIIKDETRLRDRWISAGKHLLDTSAPLELLRAEIAGQIIVNSFANGTNSVLSQRRFNAAAAQNDFAEGWYFDDECLKGDGWIVTEGITEKTETKPSRTWTGWKKAQ